MATKKPHTENTDIFSDKSDSTDCPTVWAEYTHWVDYKYEQEITEWNDWQSAIAKCIWQIKRKNPTCFMWLTLGSKGQITQKGRSWQVVNVLDLCFLK